MPLFTSVAVLTLAIGIGANTAIFSVIEGVLLKPLPYPRSDELVTLDHAAPGINLPHAGAAPFLYFTYREDGRVFQDVGLWNTGTVSVTGLAEPEEVPTLFVTDGVLPMLGVQPVLGRLFSRTDDAPGGPGDGRPDVRLLAVEVRRRPIGDRPHADARRPAARDHRRAARTFRFLDRSVSLVVPYRLDRSKVFLGQFSFTAMARLKPGVTIAQASADVARLIPISLTRFPPFPGGTSRCSRRRGSRRHRSLKDDLVGDVRKRAVGADGHHRDGAADRLRERREPAAGPRRGAAAGAGGSCGARRRHERGSRASCCWKAWRSASCGGLVGLALAFGALRLLVALAPGNLPRLEDITIDVPVLLFTLVCQWSPACCSARSRCFKYARAQLGAMLRGGGRTASASRSGIARATRWSSRRSRWRSCSWSARA